MQPPVAPSRAPSTRRGPYADLLAELNHDRTALAEVRHDATVPFGPSMRVERFILGNGLKVLLLEEAGAETNAATFLDWTYYHMNLPRDALGLAMKLESGRIARLVLRDPQV